MNSDFCVAVHALVYLNHREKVLCSEELADNICTNAARVRKVMCRLKAAHLVETKEGIEGGYRFVGPADRMTLSDVASALDICFVTTNWHSGDEHNPCMIAAQMASVMDHIMEDLDERCKERLSQITIADIERQIFMEKRKA